MGKDTRSLRADGAGEDANGPPAAAGVNPPEVAGEPLPAGEASAPPRTDRRRGLSTAEVAARHAAGLGNAVPFRSSRSYSEILRDNVFTFINLVIFGLGVALIALGRPDDALVSAGVISMNVAVSLVQEVRAKRMLDRIALLTRPTVTALRDGTEESIDQSDIVVGDILVVQPGDQVVVDGLVVEGDRVDVDESLLTGESHLIAKRVGDAVYSGSFCVAGSCLYEATRVGAESVAARITAGARAFRRILTPLQQEINMLVRLILVLVVYFQMMLVTITLLRDIPVVESVKMATVIVGLVPNGLFLAIAAAYAIGAVRMVGKGVLVQQSNAVESLSNVDVLCLDKTGTLTSNRIRCEAVLPIDVTEEELCRLLGHYAASVSAANRTGEAIAVACPGEPLRPVDEVEFSSARRWSALSFDREEARGVFVLGAPEALAPNLRVGYYPKEQAEAWMERGLRVLLFAHRPESVPLYDQAGQPVLPDGLTPLGLICLSDELRPHVRDTLEGFARGGVRLKIISGDNPRTVWAVARQAGLEAEAEAVSGADLAGLNPAELALVADRATIFGRVSPQQKELLVKALRGRGRYVAMVGDGVNDVLSLKQAQLGIAMESGSQATRAVADIVLLGDSFASLPDAVREGQRIVNGMQDVLKLFLTRVFTSAVLIISIGVAAGFPFAPKHNALLTLLTVGIPSIMLAAWAIPAPVRRGRLVRRLLHFVLPATATMSVGGLAVYLLYLVPVYRAVTAVDPPGGQGALLATSLLTPQTALTTFIIACGLILVVFIELPNGGATHKAKSPNVGRAVALSLVLGALFVGIVAQPDLHAFFDLAPLGAADFAIIGAMVVLWAVGLRWVWRARLLDRLLGVDLSQDTRVA